MKKGLTGAQLKWIAIITMVIDHIGAVVLEPYLTMLGLNPFGGFTSPLIVLYWILRLIGRLSFPIFGFLLVQGFIHTSNVWKYLLMLIGFSIISEIPFDLATNNVLLELSYQNIFFTLSLALILMVLSKEQPNWIRIIIFIIGGLINEFILKADYGFYGILMIGGLYLLNNKTDLRNIFVFMVGLSQFTQGLSVLFINAYNGLRGNQYKYFFYLFYPIHLIILYFFMPR